jgi:hypothetical protein
MAIQTMGSSQQIGAGYNLAPAFSYLMKSRNVDLSPFEKSQQQMAYEQAVGQWQQAAAQVAELAKAATMKIDGVTMDALQQMIQKLLPAQPTPQQFGYQPGVSPEQQGSSPGATSNSQSAAASQGAGT